MYIMCVCACFKDTDCSYFSSKSCPESCFVLFFFDFLHLLYALAIWDGIHPELIISLSSSSFSSFFCCCWWNCCCCFTRVHHIHIYIYISSHYYLTLLPSDKAILITSIKHLIHKNKEKKSIFSTGETAAPPFHFFVFSIANTYLGGLCCFRFLLLLFWWLWLSPLSLITHIIRVAQCRPSTVCTTRTNYGDYVGVSSLPFCSLPHRRVCLCVCALQKKSFSSPRFSIYIFFSFSPTVEVPFITIIVLRILTLTPAHDFLLSDLCFISTTIASVRSASAAATLFFLFFFVFCLTFVSHARIHLAH